MRAQHEKMNERIDQIERRSLSASVHGPNIVPPPTNQGSPGPSHEAPKEATTMSVPDLLKGLQHLLSQATGSQGIGAIQLGEEHPTSRRGGAQDLPDPPPRPAEGDTYDYRQGAVRFPRPPPAQQRGCLDSQSETDEFEEAFEDFHDEEGYPACRGQFARRGRNRRVHQERPRDEAPLPHPRMECPIFNGTKVRDWVCKVEKYFQCQRIAHKHKIDRAMMHFEDKALQWYQYTMRKTPNQDWDQFRAGLIEKFERASQRDFVVQLSSLRQTGSVIEYQDQFERLYCLVEDWNDDALVGVFIAGLQPEIHLAVQTQPSRDLRVCMKVARDKEEKIELKRSIRREIKGHDSHRDKPPMSIRRDFKKDLPPPKFTPRKVTYITKEERGRRFQQGLCYNCEEKYQKGHVCKVMRVYVVLKEGEEPPIIEDSSEEEEVPAEVLVEAAVGEEKSCYSLTDPTKAKAMRVRGYVNKVKVVVLLDSGAIHNFMSLEVAQELGCVVEPQSPFTVMVGDGSKLSCNGQCKDLEIIMHKVPFKVDVFVS
ncbi:hypothetical protein EJ110_NYTH51075 [Nymphaea thermarum]|nr:hypothetical protein EJ110_NYTH51075 [Nymphaea thermarum]